MIRGFFGAHAFLTRIPMPARVTRHAMTPWTLVWFPVVGLTVGVAAAGARWAADPLGPLAAAIVAVAVVPILTGAFHEDGLADTADGLGPHDTQRRREVMRDPRLGAFGVLALVVSVLFKVALIASLTVGPAAGALIAGHVLGRASAAPTSRWVPAARDEGLGAGIGTPSMGVVVSTIVVSAVLAGSVVWLLVAPWALVAVPVAFLVAWLVGVGARRAFGGITGDVLGAANQCAEMATYVVVVAVITS